MRAEPPIEAVRRSLAGADQALRDAERYDRMHNALKHAGEHRMKVQVESKVRYIFGGGANEAIVLSGDDARSLSEWFYEKADSERRRATAYENRAIEEAAKATPKKLHSWQPEGGVNPNRLTISISDVEPDPAELSAPA